MKDIFVKPLMGTADKNPEVAKALEALGAIRERSHIDPDVLTYPTTTLLCAYVKATREPVLYVPVQQVYMLDGLGPAPMASPIDVAGALAQVIKHIHWESYKQGIGEIYFPCEDESVGGLAKRHCFNIMDYEKEGVVSVENPEGQPSRHLMPFWKMKVYR